MTSPEIQAAMIEILSDINPDVDWNAQEGISITPL